MASPVPNNKTLIIPGKNDKKIGYPTDMRTIEMWAKDVGFIKEIVGAGGITITNPEGPITTVTGSGGGGGSFGQFQLIAQPDDNQWSTGFFFPFVNSDPTLEGASYFQVPSAGTSGWLVNMGSSWMTDAGPGDSVNIFPQITVPAFTGGTGFVSFQFSWWAANATFSEYIVYINGAHLLTSGSTYQYVAGDFTLQVSGGADLSLVAGGGITGTGLVSAAGGIPYWAGVAGTLGIPAGTTFT